MMRCETSFDSRGRERLLTARILDGNHIRDTIYAELENEIEELRDAGILPGLAALLVGDHPASRIYVKNKIAACEKLGLASWRLTPPDTVSTEQMLELVDELNHREDVDGFHPSSLGRLVSGRPSMVPCTPAGVMEILRRSEIPIEGADAVVLGRSDIVGKPMALLLMHAHATVTICHSKTRHLRDVTRRGGIVVAAMGRAAMVAPDWIRPGATVVDVGINRVTDAADAERLFANFSERLEQFRIKGSTLVGDVHPDVAGVG